MSRAGAVIPRPSDGVIHYDHHLNGWFHYCFNFNHCHRQFPCTETFIDTLIDMYNNQMLESKVFGRGIGFREIDWVFPINRATWQVGYRREEAKELMRHFALKHVDYINSLDVKTHEEFNDLHALFAAFPSFSLRVPARCSPPSP